MDFRNDAFMTSARLRYVFDRVERLKGGGRYKRGVELSCARSGEVEKEIRGVRFFFLALLLIEHFVYRVAAPDYQCILCKAS